MIQAKILVVDDESFITRSVKHFLEKEGYEVLIADTGEEGLDIFRAESPDVVLLDVNLPGMSGLEAVKALRELSGDVVIIMVTAHGNIETEVSAIKLGIHDFLEKPFDLTRLSLIIKKALETISLRKELAFLREDQCGNYSFESLGTFEKNMAEELVALALRMADGDQTRAARLLGISRDVLRRRMQKFGLLK